jgi:phage terminase large subunit-like protein
MCTGSDAQRGNLYPAEQWPEQKIDAAVALMMAVGRAKAADDGQADLMKFLRNPVFG